MRVVRRVQAVWAIGAVAATVWACENARNPGGVQPDVIAPNITLSIPGGGGSSPATADTQPIATGLAFSITASDNLGLKTIRLTYSGGYVAGPADTTFNTTVKSLTIPKIVTFPVGSGAGGLVQIVGRAIDGNGNFAEDTLWIVLSNISALRVVLIAPTPGAVASRTRGSARSDSSSRRRGRSRIPRRRPTTPSVSRFRTPTRCCTPIR